MKKSQKYFELFLQKRLSNVGVLFCFHPSWNTWKQCILQFFLQIMRLQTSHCIRKRSELSLQTSGGKACNGSGLTATTFARMGTNVRLYFFYNIFVAKLVVTPTKIMSALTASLTEASTFFLLRI